MISPPPPHLFSSSCLSPFTSSSSQLSPSPPSLPLCLTADEVKVELKKLNAGKAAGPDKVCPRLLKVCADQRAEPFQELFNLSLVREGPGSVENIMSRAGTQDWAPGRAQRLQTGGPHVTCHEDTGAAVSAPPETSD